MLKNERETFKLLKRLSKAIIAINSFSNSAEARIIVVEHDT